MAKGTKIQWATATWSPFIGCSKVSPACDNCYAERWAKQYRRDFSKVVRANGTSFNAPKTWRRPERIFVCSLSDFFHPDIYRADRHDAIRVMRGAPQHTYMLLTKRPELIKAQLAGTAWGDKLPDNVWLGVTAENQEQADKRIPLLLSVPARVHFVSCEPMLGYVDLRAYMAKPVPYDPYHNRSVSWVVCGGESGPHARPLHPAWARILRDQCAAAGVPYMFKQWGEWCSAAHTGLVSGIKMVSITDDGRVYEPSALAYPDGERRGEAIRADFSNHNPIIMRRMGKTAAGRILDGVLHDGLPEAK